MFGIGAGELIIIAIVVLLAVGPDQMPKMLRTVGRGMRQVRAATRELQSTVGVDQLLNDDAFRDPLGLKPKPPAAKPVAPLAVAKAPARSTPSALSPADYEAEQPDVGVDLELAYARADEALAAEAAAEASEPVG